MIASSILSIVLMMCTPPTANGIVGWAAHGWMWLDWTGTPHYAIARARCRGET